MAQHDGKIFGIGFYKTGTTTLYDALRTLGYHTVNGDKPGSYPGADDGAPANTLSPLATASVTVNAANNVPLLGTNQLTLDEGATVVASRRHGSGDLLDDFLKDYTVKDLVSAGSSLKFCLVASGRADLYPRFGRTMEWDTAAGHAVLLAAGGTVETIAGGEVATTPGVPLSYGKPGLENPFFIARGAADDTGDTGE